MRKDLFKNLICFVIINISFPLFAQQTIVIDYNILINNKGKIHNPNVKLLVNKLVEDANSSLKLTGLTVTKKSIIPPSGSKNDYLSRAPYWWPNPNTKSGLPYIVKDGQNNPERLKIKDLSDLIKMSKAVKTLGLAYFFTGEKRYSAKVEELVNIWFLDPKTKMNPNLNYGQAVPGVKDGRIDGIIDTKYLIDVIDGVMLVKGSVSNSTYSNLVKWFSSFEDWMNSSALGQQGKNLKNNIGTAYLMQRVAYLRFIGKDKEAVSLLKEQVPRLMKIQFDIDGEQLLENKRTKSWSYNLANLKYWFNIAKMGEDLNLDVWNYTISGSPIIKKSYYNLSKFADGEGVWNKKQISKINYDESFASLRYTGNKKFGIQRTDDSKKVSPIILLTENNF